MSVGKDLCTSICKCDKHSGAVMSNLPKERLNKMKVYIYNFQFVQYTQVSQKVLQTASNFLKGFNSDSFYESETSSHSSVTSVSKQTMMIYCIPDHHISSDFSHENVQLDIQIHNRVV